jgi:hypothetical protein
MARFDRIRRFRTACGSELVSAAGIKKNSARSWAKVNFSSASLKWTLAAFGLLISLPSVSPQPPSTLQVNVRDYGAKGDGVSDDTAAIRASLTAVPLSGGTVYLPCGTYLISSGLTITTSHTTITSEGECATLKMTGREGFVALTIRGKGLTGPALLTQDASANVFTVGAGELKALAIAGGNYAIVSDKAVPSNGPNSPPIETQQVVKITGVIGDTATIEGYFAHNFTLVSTHRSNQGCCPYVQRIIEPADDVRILHLSIDASANTGSSTGAVHFLYATNSEIGFVTATNFAQKPGPTEAFLLDTGYQNSFHDISCKACGNGVNADGASMAIRRQTRATMSNISISNTAAQSTFSFNLASVNYSSARKLFIDGGGADGRPFKLLRANHNTFSEVTAVHGGHGKNGISVTDMSTYNTFLGCVTLSNDGTGIMMFGNFNDHNTFVSCISKDNTSSQFGQGQDAFGSYGDHFTTIEGGIFCCGRGHSNLLQINSDDFTMTNAQIYDDRGMAPNGIVIKGARPVLKNNTIAGFPIAHDVIYSKE